ncbi:hypothetical protein QR680_003860 [Steinernema hermaphroditum]|uniref:Uncharacterized protein n=1 Tax=Steinernema hermaphroditum TaxID=289476 RepID=A0AA39HLU2_9BILA|nr:hypothetical protein QR680_003860 [Steinernema hermaphroditum]
MRKTVQNSQPVMHLTTYSGFPIKFLKPCTISFALVLVALSFISVHSNEATEQALKSVFSTLSCYLDLVKIAIGVLAIIGVIIRCKYCILPLMVVLLIYVVFSWSASAIGTALMFSPQRAQLYLYMTGMLAEEEIDAVTRRDLFVGTSINAFFYGFIGIEVSIALFIVFDCYKLIDVETNTDRQMRYLMMTMIV